MLSNIDFGSYFHTKKYEKGLSTGGDKIADWGGSKGGWGGHVPPSLYVKRGPVITDLRMTVLLQNTMKNYHGEKLSFKVISKLYFHYSSLIQPWLLVSRFWVQSTMVIFHCVS